MEIVILICMASMVVLCASLLALTESSISIVDEIKLKQIMKKDLKNKNSIKIIIEDKRDYIATLTLISSTLNIVGSTLVGVKAKSTFGYSSTETFLFTMGLTYFILVFSRILPKIVAINDYENVLQKTALIVRVVRFLMTPFLFLVTFWSKIVEDNRDEANINDLKSTVDYYSEKGVLNEEQSKLVFQIFSMKEKTINKYIEIKDEEDEIYILEEKEKIADCENLIKTKKIKRYILKNENGISGLVLSRDIREKLKGTLSENDTVDTLKYEVVTISENDNLLDSLMKFKEAELYYGIVVDEKNNPLAMVTEKQLYAHILKTNKT